MEKSLMLFRVENDEPDPPASSNIKCDECNKPYEKPIVATISSNGTGERYYACPRCLTKVGEVQHSHAHREETDKPPVTVENVSRLELKRDSDGKCSHFLGYLKKRPKDTSFPEECLTCDKMIECLR